MIDRVRIRTLQPQSTCTKCHEERTYGIEFWCARPMIFICDRCCLEVLFGKPLPDGHTFVPEVKAT